MIIILKSRYPLHKFFYHKFLYSNNLALLQLLIFLFFVLLFLFFHFNVLWQDLFRVYVHVLQYFYQLAICLVVYYFLLALNILGLDLYLSCFFLIIFYYQLFSILSGLSSDKTRFLHPFNLYLLELITNCGSFFFN